MPVESVKHRNRLAFESGDQLGVGVSHAEDSSLFTPRCLHGCPPQWIRVNPTRRLPVNPQRAGQAEVLTLAAADSGMGSYRANERVKDPAPWDSERKSIA